MRTAAKLALGSAVVGVVAFWLILPPAPLHIESSPDVHRASSVVRGAFHVHTNRSDGSGSVESIAEAARAAGLQFLVFTDHGNGLRVPAPPTYRSGVLCIDAVEISTDGGHYIAVGLDGPTPYPLGGDARGVVEDVRRLGGLGIVAHPMSPKPALVWSDRGLAVDGFEWVNGDSQWRDDSWFALGAAGATYLARPVAALGSLLDRPATALAWWDESPERPLVGLAGADAHARLGFGDEGEGYQSSFTLAFPGYEEVFRTFGLRVELERDWRGEPGDDARQLIHALRAGRTFAAADAFATPVSFRFRGITEGGRVVPMGATTALRSLELQAAAVGPPGTVVRLFQDGRVIEEARDAELVYQVVSPGVFRVEVHLASAYTASTFPWIVSNPIYVKQRSVAQVTTAAWVPTVTRPIMRGRRGDGGWVVESDATSSGELMVMTRRPERQVELQYRLGDDSRGGAYAAAAYHIDLGDLAGLDRFAFVGSADRPHRVSIQLRAGRLEGQPRWRHSVYLGNREESVSTRFSDFRLVDEDGPAAGLTLDLGEIDTLLIVIDLTNNIPEAVGRLTIRNPRLEGGG